MNRYPGPHRRWTAGLCANCEEPLSPSLDIKLYCDDFCREWAKDVRYFRAAEADGRAKRDPLVAEALRTKMAFILAGGYDAQARKLSREVRRKVLARNGGLCVSCNEREATEVDHIDGDSPDPSNLQGLCHPCHQAKTESRFVPLRPEDRIVQFEFLSHVREEEPLMAAHSAEWAKEWKGRQQDNLRWAANQLEAEEWVFVDGKLVPREQGDGLR